MRRRVVQIALIVLGVVAFVAFLFYASDDTATKGCTPRDDCWYDR